jgi:hypothetical protein
MLTPVNHELHIAAKHGLYWSLTLIEDENGTAIADGFYIYEPDRYSSPFWEIAEKLRQLNDYCFHQLVSSQERLSDLQLERSKLMEQRHCSAEEIDVIDEAIPLWEDNASVVSHAVPVVLLSSFIEWGLKSLAKEFCGSVPRKAGATLSDIDFLLNHIRGTGGLAFELDMKTLETLNSFRIVRNQFAHGNWHSLETLLGTLSLRSCFAAVTRLLEALEDSAWKGPWSTTNA